MYSTIDFLILLVLGPHWMEKCLTLDNFFENILSLSRIKNLCKQIVLFVRFSVFLEEKNAIKFKDFFLNRRFFEIFLLIFFIG